MNNGNYCLCVHLKLRKSISTVYQIQPFPHTVSGKQHGYREKAVGVPNFRLKWILGGMSPRVDIAHKTASMNSNKNKNKAIHQK